MCQLLPLRLGIGNVTAPELATTLQRPSNSLTHLFVQTSLVNSNAVLTLLNKQLKLIPPQILPQHWHVPLTQQTSHAHVRMLQILPLRNGTGNVTAPDQATTSQWPSNSLTHLFVLTSQESSSVALTPLNRPLKWIPPPTLLQP